VNSREPGAGNREPDGAHNDPAELMPQVYDELRRLAANYLRHERPGQTLQATALVHEAFLRLSTEKNPPWKNRAHFLAIAALSMRQILVQRARARHAAKRGGIRERITLDDANLANAAAGFAPVRDSPDDIDLIALDDALTRLSDVDSDLARLVELRYFGGMTVEETADALGVSPATVKRQWSAARAWLKRAIEGDAPARDA